MACRKMVTNSIILLEIRKGGDKHQFHPKMIQTKSNADPNCSYGIQNLRIFKEIESLGTPASLERTILMHFLDRKC